MKELFALVLVSLLVSGCGGGKQPDAEARRWLDLEIERPEIAVPVIEVPEFLERRNDLPEGAMFTNTFIVPPSYLSSAPSAESGNEAAPDPFAPPTPSGDRLKPQILMPAWEVLEAYGVVFEEGASAHYSPKAGKLVVTQTLDQMDLVEAIIHSGCNLHERQISVHFEIFELAADAVLRLEQSAGDRSEHSREHEAVLELVRENEARIVTSARLLCRSGQRAHYSDAKEFRYVSGFAKGGWEGSEAGEEDVGPLLPVLAVRKVGTIVEADPVLGPDDVTIDLNFRIDHHLAPPEWPEPAAGASRAPRFHVGSIEASELIISGQVKLICSWAVPPGESDQRTRHLVFIRVTAVRR